MKPIVVPIRLAPNNSDHLWNYSIWLTDGTNSNDKGKKMKDFTLLHQNKRMHCVIYHIRQEMDMYILSQNLLLSDRNWSWFSNVLVMWANNDWLGHLQPDLGRLQDVLYM